MPTGRIKYYNLDKGFGFIAQDSSEEDVFLHSSAIKYAECEELRVGQRVKYTVVEGEKGLVAKNVEVLLTPTERRWLRQGKTIIPRGYSGFPSQNQDQFFNEDEKLSDESVDKNSDTNAKHTRERWRKQPQRGDASPQSEISKDGKEQTSRQLSFGDLYILKQINFETPMFFALYDDVQLPAIVLEMTLNGLTLNCNGNEKVVPKTEVKYCYKDVDAENVIALLRYNEDIKTKQLKPALSQDEVYTIDAETIRDARKDGNSIEIILREGEFFQGTVDWISPYEIKLVLKNGSKVVVFRHAICEFSLIKGKIKMETQPEHVIEHVMTAYHELVAEIDQDVKRVREEYGRFPCPSDCFQCCRNTSTIPISEVEARDLKTALDALPKQVREHIRQKAQRTIEVLEAQGYTAENMRKDSGMEAIEVVKGKSYGECPMLIGGVCSVYEHRPVICRVWGYPIDNGKELACCKKTFIGQHKNYEPVKYADYWQTCKKLSEALGAVQKTPNCYLVIELIDDKDSEGNNGEL